MLSSDPLLGPRIKLERAQHHLAELERIEREFFQNNPARIVFDTDTQPGHKLAKVVLDAHPPELMHVIVGELIYQLRSALDQTAVAFARLSKNDRVRPKDIYFPSGDSLRGFLKSCGSFDKKNKRLVGNLRYFDCDLRKEIMRTRPYDGGNDALRAVFRLANIDKHLELIPMNITGGIGGLANFEITGAFKGLIIGETGNLNTGVVFSDLMPHGRIVPKNSHANVSIKGQIMFEDAGPYERQSMVTSLRTMLREVTAAHARFQTLLQRTGRIIPARGRAKPMEISYSIPSRAYSLGVNFVG